MTITINGSTGISGVDGSASTPAFQGGDANTGISFPAADTVAINTDGSERVRCDSSGRVGIGTTSPSQLFHVNGGYSLLNGLRISGADTANSVYQSAAFGISSDNYITLSTGAGGPFERARIDSSGRLLVGTSSSRSVAGVEWNQQTEGTSYTGASFVTNANSGIGSYVVLGKSRGTSVGSNTIVQNGDTIGVVSFAAADGTDVATEAANIAAFVDGTPGANDMPGRIVLATTADGASSPTERMRIQSGGHITFGANTSISPAYDNVANICIDSFNNYAAFSRSGAEPISINRKTSDGNLVTLHQDGTIEGTISVSGTTVSYNGAHLSRWSQLPSGAERTEILRGTVLSNIDEMCEWGEEDNEQLNRMKVSDVEGDKNVAGVFQAWDDDDDTYTNDFYCAMTGDFIIRIGAGVTVERGDLLMSAGDGTAKPQDDDIIRSKTIAKVTSTTVSCTYDDGSYCVPCVLMAC